jgi:hypothetical protein
MRLIDPAGLVRRDIVVARGYPFALDIVPGFETSSNIACRRTDPVIDVRIALEIFTGYAEPMAAIDILIDFGEKIALIEVYWIGLGSRCAIATNVAHVFEFMALPVSALDQEFRIVGACCHRGVRAPAPVGIVIDALGYSAPTTPVGQKILRIERLQLHDTAQCARAVAAGIGALGDVDRRKPIEIHGVQPARIAARVGQPRHPYAVDRRQNAGLIKAPQVDAIVPGVEIDASIDTAPKIFETLDHALLNLLPVGHGSQRGFFSLGSFRPGAFYDDGFEFDIFTGVRGVLRSRCARAQTNRHQRTGAATQQARTQSLLSHIPVPQTQRECLAGFTSHENIVVGQWLAERMKSVFSRRTNVHY